MYNLEDTIVAVSSPTSDRKVIIRITGPEAVNITNRIFTPGLSSDIPLIVSGQIAVDSELEIDVSLYLFLEPNSYTGQDLVEIHLHTNPAVVEAIMEKLLTIKKMPIRMAEPGEFTARGYLNGKFDLAQAEAVGEIIASSNRLQLTAAEKLLEGKLGEKTHKIRNLIIESLTLIEAELDFSQEDIPFLSHQDVIKRLKHIQNELEGLLAGSISYESVIDLPAVAIAGSPNVGKSSLVNKLLGEERSIVSETKKTTRDILTGQLNLTHCRCVLFDCAGLLTNTCGLLDKLVQTAAVQALRNSSLIIFCIDLSKQNWTEDIYVKEIIENNSNASQIINIATKSDLLPEQSISNRLKQLQELFKTDFLLTSVETGEGLEKLRGEMDEKITNFSVSLIGANRSKISENIQSIGPTLTSRHRNVVTKAIENVIESIDELKSENNEVTAMLLRVAYRDLSEIDQPQCEHLDEEILDKIFSRFCIGK